MAKNSQVFVFCFVAIATSAANADQGAFTNASGAGVGVGGVTITASTTTPAGSLNMTCTGSAPQACAGGSLTFLSSDGTASMNASFTSGTYAESCSGGGRGGHYSCSWSLSGFFSGTYRLNGQSQAINGVTFQSFSQSGANVQGTTAWNSAYTPFYYSDSGQILRSDDLQGTNQIAYGTQGSGVGQFYGAYGIALDSLGRIYIADTYNGRIVRIDDMTGRNWTSFGTYGTGPGQFTSPMGIAVDSAGKIYVLDSGSKTVVVRMDDMKGTNWVSYGSVGSGVGEFSQYLSSLTVDASSRIYVADTGNKRIVRMDDMHGTNWATLTQSPPVNGVSYYSFQSPSAVALDSSGRIYVADFESYSPAVIRVDDMAGNNWTSAWVAAGGSISIDSSGSVFLGSRGPNILVDMTGVLKATATISPYGSYYVFGITPLPLKSPRPAAMTFSPATLTFGSQNIGTASAPQPVTVNNFGGSPLNFSSITATGGFVDTTGCGSSLAAGSSCTVYVSFKPSVKGPAMGSLTFADDSGNLGAKQVVTLSGFATAPAAYVVPGKLVFPAQLVTTVSAAQSVVLQNTGDGPMHVTNLATAAPFTQTNTCGGTITAGAGCTILVSFKPAAAGSASGSLTIAGNAGAQTVPLTGTGSATAATVNVAPSALLFPEQLVGGKSASQVVTVSNNGKTAVTNKGVTISGDFAETTTCTSSLAAGKSCTVTVTFKPTMVGARTGALSMGLSTGSQTVSLAGPGANGSSAGALSLTPSPLVFAGYTVGDNPSQTVTVTNAIGFSVGIATIALKGDPSLTQQNQCGPVLAPGATCAINVTFQPAAYGTFTGALTLIESSGAQDVVSVTASAVPDS